MAGFQAQHTSFLQKARGRHGFGGAEDTDDLIVRWPLCLPREGIKAGRYCGALIDIYTSYSQIMISVGVSISGAGSQGSMGYMTPNWQDQGGSH